MNLMKRKKQIGIQASSSITSIFQSLIISSRDHEKGANNVNNKVVDMGNYNAGVRTTKRNQRSNRMIAAVACVTYVIPYILIGRFHFLNGKKKELFCNPSTYVRRATANS